MTRPVQLVLFDDAPWRRGRWRLARRARHYGNGRLLLAGGVVFDDEGRVLLIHRATPGLTQWETPGGKVDKGESPEAAAVRELSEELGIDVRIVADWGSHNIDGASQPMTYALFEVRALEPPKVVETDTFDKLRFFAWAELLPIEHELSPNARNLLTMWRRGKLRPKPYAGQKTQPDLQKPATA